MNTDLMLQRLKLLCEKKGITMTSAFIESGVGKNFKSNLKTSNPSKKNITILANYFNVPIEYLTGELEQESIQELAKNEMVNWLQNNGYFIIEDKNNIFTIKKENKCYQINKSELEQESLQIKDSAKNGFHLAMKDWEKRTFQFEVSSLSEEERYVVEIFREVSRAGKAKIYQTLLNVQGEEEKEKIKNKSMVG